MSIRISLTAYSIKPNTEGYELEIITAGEDSYQLGLNQFTKQKTKRVCVLLS